MYPILVSLGPFHLYSFGTLFVIGIIISWLLTRYLVHFYRLQLRHVYVLLPWVIIVGIVTARLGYVMTNFSKFAHNFWSIFAFQSWLTELDMWAGIVGVFCMAMIYWLKHHESVFLWLDVLTLGIQPSIFFIALGLHLSPVGLTTHALGQPTSLPWGIVVDSVDLPFANVPVHPILLYYAFAAVIVFVGAWLLRRWAKLYVGRLFVWMTAVFGLNWLFIFFVQWHSEGAFLGFDVALFNAMLYIGIAVICGVYIVRKRYWATIKADEKLV
ncbi:MAG: hypothetical protein A2V81_02060 [Candidatus Abawacabacteria bacterium RBG_16_42_10]|uniref:Prolipoprotein diacylglyceryl transferase n=1 Tax=Candidatus Abawacabacteria bacterium RBG_16_42_10 TaxID=1817814 RepID=A0A1F4XL07_9BACT|nr:MAG: hypothetical protein A2V81_02060 [Candidatus Abawacabacteria bacterium RBG_16_42_10]